MNRLGRWGRVLRRAANSIPGRSLGRLRHEHQQLHHLVAVSRDEALSFNHRIGHLEDLVHAARASAAPVPQQLRSLERRYESLVDDNQRLAAAVHWLSSHHVGPEAPDGAERTTLVSVILPTFERGAVVADAVESVLAQTHRHWELVVVDDGSTDDTAAVLASVAGTDPRVRVLHRDHRGHAAARNAGLQAAHGDVVCYLDSDDRYFPTHLAHLVEAYGEQPDIQCAVTTQLFVDGRTSSVRLVGGSFDRAALERNNTVPLPAFSHRRALHAELGGFDESLTRLVDWDLILRYTENHEPAIVEVISGECRTGDHTRVSESEPHASSDRVVRGRLAPRLADGLRVLYVGQYLPTVSESYVVAEMNEVIRQGGEVAAWSELEPPAPMDVEFPVHRSSEMSLADAIAKYRPHVVHSHHLYMTERYLPEIAPTGVPVTSRAHGVDFDRGSVERVMAHPAVHSISMFPHLVDALGPIAGRVHPAPVAFDPDRFGPVRDKERSLVVRTSLGAPTKDLVRMLEIAARCPDHRFVLVAAWSVSFPDHIDELRALNERLGAGVEILENLQPDEAASYVRRAGIYLHTHALDQPYGMPISIAEAMATGAFVVARRCPASVDYIGAAGTLYDDTDEAVRAVRATTEWSDEVWHEVWLRAVERAHSLYRTDVVLEGQLRRWQELRTA